MVGGEESTTAKILFGPGLERRRHGTSAECGHRRQKHYGGQGVRNAEYLFRRWYCGIQRARGHHGEQLLAHGDPFPFPPTNLKMHPTYSRGLAFGFEAF